MKIHRIFGMEWSGAYYIAYDCKGKDMRPEYVFEYCGGKSKRLKRYEHKPLKELSLITAPWTDDKLAEEAYRIWEKKLPYKDYTI